MCAGYIAIATALVSWSPTSEPRMGFEDRGWGPVTAHSTGRAKLSVTPSFHSTNSAPLSRYGHPPRHAKCTLLPSQSCPLVSYSVLVPTHQCVGPSLQGVLKLVVSEWRLHMAPACPGTLLSSSCVSEWKVCGGSPILGP